VPRAAGGCEHCLYLSGTRIHLKRYAPARRDRDLSVDSKSFRRPQAGEGLCNGPFPFTNYSPGHKGVFTGHRGGVVNRFKRIDGLQSKFRS
jgi:hypothetical protein